MWFLKYCVIAVCLVLSVGTVAYAQQNAHAVKAAFIYNFVNYVEWPKAVRPTSSKTTICVVGDAAEVIAYLNELGKKVPVMIVTKGRDSRLDDCHILYIGAVSITDVDYLIGKTAMLPILTVSSSKDFAKRKGIVGFVVQAQQVNLEINLTSVSRSGLVIDSELLELTKIYR